MKNAIIVIVVFAISFAACNSGTNKLNESASKSGDTAVLKSETKNEETKGNATIKEIVSNYLQIKNALANDNGKEAATAGNAMVDAIGKTDKTSFTAEQKKVYDDAADDAKEHAEHIGMNAEKLAHQREHFDMLSNDVYDMVKTLGAGQPLYKDFCPMYNDKKGAIWLSETKEIKNPYMGKKMATCGEVKEELK